MRRTRPFRWAAVLAPAIALAAGRASAADEGTLTIQGTFAMDELQEPVGSDLRDVFAHGGEHTWTLTMHGTTWSHWSSTDGTFRFTEVRAASIDLEFAGPDAETLNQVVAGALAGGEAQLELRNSYGTSASLARLSLWIVPSDPAAGISMWAGHDYSGPGQNFPADADGYPVLTTDPLSVLTEVTYLLDNRSGNSGYLASWDDVLVLAGDFGSPVAPTLRILDGSTTEGSRGSRKLPLVVTLANTSDHAITVSYRTVSGTALPKSDYTATSGTLTFNAGETRKTVSVSIKGDRTVEPDEAFTVELYNPVGTTIDDAVGVATILNDD